MKMKPDLIDYTDAPITRSGYRQGSMGDRLHRLNSPPPLSFGKATTRELRHPPGVQPDRVGIATDFHSIFHDRMAARNVRIAQWANMTYFTTNWDARKPSLRCSGAHGYSWDNGTLMLHAPKCRAVLRYRWPA